MRIVVDILTGREAVVCLTSFQRAWIGSLQASHITAGRTQEKGRKVHRERSM